MGEEIEVLENTHLAAGTWTELCGGESGVLNSGELRSACIECSWPDERPGRGNDVQSMGVPKNTISLDLGLGGDLSHKDVMATAE